MTIRSEQTDKHDDLDHVLTLPTRVLVVDDEDAALAVIPETLKDGLEDLGWKSLTIETAQSGEEALEVAGHTHLQLLVADVVMPGIDGIETYAQLKERFPQLACVVMTAQAPEHITPVRALRLGAADYIKKPINPEYLVKTCHRQLIVTHLRRTVEESRSLLESIVSSVGDGVVALRDNHVLSINAAAESILGSDYDNISAQLQRLELGQARPGPEESGTREIHDVNVPSTLGHRRSVSVIGSPVVDRAGNRLGEVLVMRDITRPMERKSLESFKRMAAIAAHEMKNSVTGLGLVTEHLVARLRDGNLDEHETQRMARIIQDSLARLNRFARSFLDFSRVPIPKPIATDPNLLVTEAVELYSQQKGLPDWAQLTTSLSHSLPQVMADPDLMFQVLQNLILNAVEAMDGAEQSAIEIKTELVEDHVSIAVSDNGPGVSPDMCERIFEPNVTTREAGSGLGLVIVRDIVHQHGGRVVLSSELGDGATFTLYLPTT